MLSVLRDLLLSSLAVGEVDGRDVSNGVLRRATSLDVPCERCPRREQRNQHCKMKRSLLGRAGVLEHDPAVHVAYINLGTGRVAS